MEVCTCHLGRHTWCRTHGWNRDHLTGVREKSDETAGNLDRLVEGTGFKPPGVKRRPPEEP